MHDGPLHGYAIITRAGELSRGRVQLATGTLYAALDRLAGEGYVASSSPGPWPIRGCWSTGSSWAAVGATVAARRARI